MVALPLVVDLELGTRLPEFDNVDDDKPYPNAYTRVCTFIVPVTVRPPLMVSAPLDRAIRSVSPGTPMF